MTTEEIMQLALEMAGFTRIPEDSGIYMAGEEIRRVLFDHTPSVARLIGKPFMNIHAPLDELGRRIMGLFHIDFGELQRLRSETEGNLVIVGHSLGFTPFLNALRERDLEVTTFSGVIDPLTGDPGIRVAEDE